MKQFDDLFRENVKKVFGSYNADHLAGEGWNSFVSARKARSRRMTVIPVLARAASVLLIVGLGAFIAYRISIRKSISVSESVVQQDRLMDAGDIERTGTGRSSGVPEPSEITEAKAAKETAASAASGKPVEYPVSGLSLAGKTTVTGTDAFAGVTAIAGNAAVSPAAHAAETVYGESRTGMKAAESYFLLPHVLADLHSSGVRKESDDKTGTGELIPSVTVSTGITSDGPGVAAKTSGQEARHGGRALIAGFSGLLARSGGSASPSSGLSVGLYLDQKLTKKISVRPGLAFAMQSFELMNGNDFIKTSGLFNDPLSLSDGTSGKPYSYDGKLNMLAMELPLNIVFRISDRKGSGFFVSAGASTMIYLSQQFTADFVNEYTRLALDAETGIYSTESRFSTLGVEKDYSAFSRTDFFGLANFSAGYNFNYSKTGTMLIEPFLQLPVSDLTSLNLRIRYGGLSMKLRFGNP